jgi:hypothetical protein
MWSSTFHRVLLSGTPNYLLVNSLIPALGVSYDGQLPDGGRALNNLHSFGVARHFPRVGGAIGIACRGGPPSTSQIQELDKRQLDCFDLNLFN